MQAFVTTEGGHKKTWLLKMQNHSAEKILKITIKDSKNFEAPFAAIFSCVHTTL